MPTKSAAILTALTADQSFCLTMTENGRFVLAPGWVDEFVREAEEDGGCAEFEYDRLLPDGGAEFSWYMTQYVVTPQDWDYLQYKLKFAFPGVVFKQCEDAVYED